LKKQDYRDNFLAFIQEVKEQSNPSFKQCDNWELPGEPLPLNGVRIDHEINNKNDRKLLHELGQENGLIPLCPNDQIGIDPSIIPNSNTTKVYVHTPFGKLYLIKHKLSS